MLIAIVRIRGRRNLSPDVRKTFELLNLKRKNYCTVVPDTPQYQGMIKKVKDYVTYGPLSKEIFVKLVGKRGEKGKKKLSVLLNQEAINALCEKIWNEEKPLSKYELNPMFRLKPPSKGMKSIKRHYPAGELGRRDNMDDLLRRMI